MAKSVKHEVYVNKEIKEFQIPLNQSKFLTNLERELWARVVQHLDAEQSKDVADILRALADKVEQWSDNFNKEA